MSHGEKESVLSRYYNHTLFAQDFYSRPLVGCCNNSVHELIVESAQSMLLSKVCWSDHAILPISDHHLFFTTTIFGENVTVHPASHKTGAETKLFCNPGNRCATDAFDGKVEISNLTVSVVRIWVPLGIVTHLAGSCCSIGMTGVFLFKRWSEAPESKKDVLLELSGLVQAVFAKCRGLEL